MAAGIGLQDTGGRLNGMFRRRGAADRRRPPERGDRPKSFLLTLIAVLFLAAFLSPLLRSATFAFKSTDQISQPGSPVYPADPATLNTKARRSMSTTCRSTARRASWRC